MWELQLVEVPVELVVVEVSGELELVSQSVVSRRARTSELWGESRGIYSKDWKGSILGPWLLDFLGVRKEVCYSEACIHCCCSDHCRE